MTARRRYGPTWEASAMAAGTVPLPIVLPWVAHSALGRGVPAARGAPATIAALTIAIIGVAIVSRLLRPLIVTESDASCPRMIGRRRCEFDAIRDVTLESFAYFKFRGYVSALHVGGQVCRVWSTAHSDQLAAAKLRVEVAKACRL